MSMQPEVVLLISALTLLTLCVECDSKTFLDFPVRIVPRRKCFEIPKDANIYWCTGFTVMACCDKSVATKRITQEHEANGVLATTTSNSEKDSSEIDRSFEEFFRGESALTKGNTQGHGVNRILDTTTSNSEKVGTTRLRKSIDDSEIDRRIEEFFGDKTASTKGNTKEHEVNGILDTTVFDTKMNQIKHLDQSLRSRKDMDESEINPCEVCVKRNMCTKKYEDPSKIDGVGIIDIRFSEDSPCHYLEECCAASDVIDEPDPIPIKKPIKKLIQIPKCGQRNSNGTGFRIKSQTDNESEYAEFPWMVAVLKLVDSKHVYLGGGSLIHPSVVLTAAHIVHRVKTNLLLTRAGEWDTETDNEPYPHQDSEVSDVIFHESFYVRALLNDIALLVLDSPVILAENVKPICLPPQDYNFDHNQCFVAGWGKDVYGQNGKYQTILKKVDLPVVPHRVCAAALRKTRLGKHFSLDKSFLCAGGVAGKDACRGDGGSPLVCPIPGTNERYYQAGIVAWGIGCGENFIPGVYVNVALFRNWIDEKIQDINLNYYTFK